MTERSALTCVDMALMAARILCKLKDGFFDDVEHEQDKTVRFSLGRRELYRTIIFFLIVFDDTLDRDPLKYRLPTCKQCRLPESARSAVSVSERMNEFKLIVEYAGADQHLRFACFQPVE